VSEIILQAVNLTRLYSVGEGIHAVNRLSLAIRRGEFLVVKGPSGCGKSTLLNLLGGLDRPTFGDITLDGVKYSRLSEDGLARLRRDRIGFVFQAYNLLADLTATENVSLPLHLLRQPERAINQRVTDLLTTVGMLPRANHTPYELSGGEQQRIAIARALANRPAVVLADEPTGNLDSRNCTEIMNLFRRLNREDGQTFVVVSHDERFAEYADRVIELADGMVATDSRPVELAVGS
jgi:putative ABC transport system ATP-binding protein